jgi:hypothetical protein
MQLLQRIHTFEGTMSDIQQITRVFIYGMRSDSDSSSETSFEIELNQTSSTDMAQCQGVRLSIGELCADNCSNDLGIAD